MSGRNSQNQYQKIYSKFEEECLNNGYNVKLPNNEIGFMNSKNGNSVLLVGDKKIKHVILYDHSEYVDYVDIEVNKNMKEISSS